MLNCSRFLLTFAAVLAVVGTSSGSAAAASQGEAVEVVTNSAAVPATNVAPDDEISPRIIGGSVASTKNYPWVVKLVGANCGGALIAPTKVLTAGHCAGATTAIIQGRELRFGWSGVHCDRPGGRPALPGHFEQP